MESEKHSNKRTREKTCQNARRSITVADNPASDKAANLLRELREKKIL
jgi:hypothetical protein